MAVEAKQEVPAITNATATRRPSTQPSIEKATLRESQGFAVITNGDSVASFFTARIPLRRPRSPEIKVYSPDIGATTAGDLGLYPHQPVQRRRRRRLLRIGAVAQQRRAGTASISRSKPLRPVA